MSLQRFIVRGQDLGTREVPSYAKSIDGAVIMPSYCFFCPSCSEIWAKVIHEHYGSYHNIWTRRCPEHAQGGMDGYISCQHSWLDDPLIFARDWPEGAVRHEFNVALKRALQEIENESARTVSGRTESFA